MQSLDISKIIATLSIERIEAYQQDCVSDEVALSRYVWNIALCQALYPSLQLCEISLRNSIHNHLSNRYGENWFDEGKLALSQWGQTQIRQAKSQLSRMKKPQTPGRIVAELSFGFWTHLLESHYEGKGGFLPTGIKGIFPYLPKSQHNRKKIKAKLDKVRTLRNRVFHHERIVHWKDLSDQHQLILEIIAHLSPEMLQLVNKIDSFQKIYQTGSQNFLVEIKSTY